MAKEYIGDGVYADFGTGLLLVTTEDGVSVQNKIYFEPEVWAALTNYVAREIAARDNAREAVARDNVNESEGKESKNG